MKQSSSGASKQNAPASLGERLLFAVWLAGKKLGVESSKQFAEEIEKGAPQLSRWVTGEQTPSWASIKIVADAVGIDPVWLDDPAREGAKEPADFAEWIVARRTRERKAKAREREG